MFAIHSNLKILLIIFLNKIVNFFFVVFDVWIFDYVKCVIVFIVVVAVVCAFDEIVFVFFDQFANANLNFNFQYFWFFIKFALKNSICFFANVIFFFRFIHDFSRFVFFVMFCWWKKLTTMIERFMKFFVFVFTFDLHVVFFFIFVFFVFNWIFFCSF